VTALLCNAKAMVQVAGVQPVGFWGLWCQFAVGLVIGGRNGCVVDVLGQLVRDLVMRWWWMRDLIEWSLMPMLMLTKNIKSVLHLCKPYLFSVDVRPASFGTLNCSLPSQDGLLFLSESLIFLLNPS
jgi:hypothetical protein